MPGRSPSTFWDEAPSDCWLVVGYQYNILATAHDIREALEKALTKGPCVLIWSPPKKSAREEKLPRREQIAA